jgi:hypothetical protein
MPGSTGEFCVERNVTAIFAGQNSRQPGSRTLMTPEIIDLPPTLSIRGIAAVHESLLDALQMHQAVTVEIPSDANTDLSFIQLIEASRLYARANGKYITLTKPASPSVVDTLRRGGFLTNMDEASRLFWLHGKEIQ